MLTPFAVMQEKEALRMPELIKEHDYVMLHLPELVESLNPNKHTEL
jgi:hypothetical protein